METETTHMRPAFTPTLEAFEMDDFTGHSFQMDGLTVTNIVPADEPQHTVIYVHGVEDLDTVTVTGNAINLSTGRGLVTVCLLPAGGADRG